MHGRKVILLHNMDSLGILGLNSLLGPLLKKAREEKISHAKGSKSG